MGLRKLLKWGFSGLSALAAVVISANIQKLMEVNGWDAFLTSSHPSVGRLAFAIGPWMLLAAVAVIAFTAGLWIDSVLAKMEDRPSPQAARNRHLGMASINLAHRINRAVTSYFSEDATPLFAEILSLLIRYEKLGFKLPTIPQQWDTNQRLSAAGHYLMIVGRLMAEGQTEEAKAMAENIGASQLTPSHLEPEG